MKDAHTIEVAKGKRFELGASWARYVNNLDASRIAQAEKFLLIARPGTVFYLFHQRGFFCKHSRSLADPGCNKFVFVREAR